MSLGDNNNYGVGDTLLGNPPDLFELLCKYHVKENLSSCLKYIQRDGRFYPPDSEKPLPEGCENEQYKGFLLIAVKDIPMEDLTGVDLLVGRNDISEFQSIEDEGDFFDYITGLNQKDGAHIIRDSGDGYEIAHAYEIKNNLPDVDYKKILPTNFICSKASSLPENPREGLGTKTPIGVRLPHKFRRPYFKNDVETYLVKRTAYGDIGIGKVVHFTESLVEEAYCEYEPDITTAHTGTDAVTFRDITLVYRKYEIIDSKVTCVKETRTCVADMYGDEMVAANLNNKAMTTIPHNPDKAACSVA